MRTRSSSNLIIESFTIPKRHNRRHSKQIVEPDLRTIVETPVATMADTRTMSKLLQAPTEGYDDAIVLPPILAENFKLKVGLRMLVTSSQFHGFERDDPHSHIRWFNKITSTLKYKNVPHDAIKLMLFPFSLEGAARIWLEKEPPRSIHTWEDLVSRTTKIQDSESLDSCRNKARLVAQGHRQEEGINYDEMDVKSAFLYGKMMREFYVSQPPGFIDPKYHKKVYKVVKALYGLHQAPRACLCLPLGDLIPWAMQKADIRPTSTTETENVVLLAQLHVVKFLRISKTKFTHVISIQLLLQSKRLNSSLTPTITTSTIMVVLESCPKHNMVAYLEKTDGNAEFHEIIDFLA
ncbi:reverse transcriptase domain-containing protein [Tanacetum coccineum]